MIHQPARRSHHNLGLLLQGLGLGDQGCAAVEHRDPDAGIKRQKTAQLVTNLNGQLPGGSQDKPLHIAAFRVHMLNHGNAKGEGFAGARRRLGNHILPG